MKISVAHRLFLTILLAVAVAVTAAFAIIQWNISRSMHRYVRTLDHTALENMAVELERQYGRHGSWDFISRDPEAMRRLAFGFRPGNERHREHDVEEHREFRDRPRHFPEGMPLSPEYRGTGDKPPHHFDQLVLVLAADRKLLFGQGAIPPDAELRPLKNGTHVVGYVGLARREQPFDALQLRFLREQTGTFLMVAMVMVILAGGLAWAMARQLLRPLRHLSEGTHRLVSGDYTVRVPPGSGDELGRLSLDFNTLALSLERNERNRRELVAGISHELRTPLAILQGEIEALQDGVRQATAETIHSLHYEVRHLGRLVDDFYQLSLSDIGALNYRKDELELKETLLDSIAPFRQRFAAKGISLEEVLPQVDLLMHADEERMRQLFSNLLANSLAYTDPGGTLRITLSRHEDGAAIDFQDSAPGVNAEDRKRLFEPLFRVEGSRNRSTGGAGLGLALCRNIVDAHGGRISAEDSPQGGVWIRVELPKAGV